jgi:predicted small lipoprotein YifL
MVKLLLETLPITLLATYPKKVINKLDWHSCAIPQREGEVYMKKISKVFAILLAIVMIVGSFAACGKKEAAQDTAENTPAATTKDTAEETPAADTAKEEKVDEIYYLNFKPEIAEVYDQIAADYEAETGIRLKLLQQQAEHTSRP